MVGPASLIDHKETEEVGNTGCLIGIVSQSHQNTSKGDIFELNQKMLLNIKRNEV